MGGAQPLLHFVRALAHVDIFRQDTQEYVAIVLSVVDTGAGHSTFVNGLLSMLEEFQVSVSVRSDSPTWEECSRLHFLMGTLANPNLTYGELFLDRVWPVIVSCVGDVRKVGHDRLTNDGRLPVALRAHALAQVCMERLGVGRSDDVRSYVASGIAALHVRHDDEAVLAMVNSVEVVTKATTRSCDEGNETAERLQNWLLRTVSQAVVDALDRPTAAEGFFKVLCGAASHLNPSLLITEANLIGLLQRHEPLRDVLLRWLVSGFSERSKEILALIMLSEFPQSLAAAQDSGLKSAL